MCQLLGCDSQDVLDTVDVDSVMGGFVEKLPSTYDIYQDETGCVIWIGMPTLLKLGQTGRLIV